jgi:hypothetical protein
MSSSGEADQSAADANKPQANAEPKHWLEYAIFVFVIATAIATSIAAYYTRQQWLTAEDQERRSLRAYVSVVVDQYPDISKEHMDIGVIYKNRGQTPAFNLHAWLLMTTDNYPMPEKVFYDGREMFSRLMANEESVLFPGAEFKGATAEGMDQFGFTNTLSPAERDAIRAGWRTMWVFGEVTYRDTFGTDRFTRFRLFMTGEYMARLSRLFWAREGNCTDETCPK